MCHSSAASENSAQRTPDAAQEIVSYGYEQVRAGKSCAPLADDGSVPGAARDVHLAAEHARGHAAGRFEGGHVNVGADGAAVEFRAERQLDADADEHVTGRV